jgi:hypothetical protein
MGAYDTDLPSVVGDGNRCRLDQPAAQQPTAEQSPVHSNPQKASSPGLLTAAPRS